MGRKNKVFGMKGQKETMDLLRGLSARSIPCPEQKYWTRGCLLAKYIYNFRSAALSNFPRRNDQWSTKR